MITLVYRLRNLLTNRLILSIRTISDISLDREASQSSPFSFVHDHVLDTIEPAEPCYGNHVICEEILQEDHVTDHTAAVESFQLKRHSCSTLIPVVRTS